MRHGNAQESQKIVDYAMTHNFNYFETSYFYLNNQCEDYVYSLLKKYPREDYKLCGKMPIKSFLKDHDFKKVYFEQLNKVPGGYFDVYLLQSLDNITAYYLAEQNIIPFFLKEKEKGHIKNFGFSSKNLYEDFEQYLSLNCWDIVQIPLNFYLWQLEETKKIYNLAKSKQLKIIAQSPLMGGELPAEMAINFIKTLDVNYVLVGTANYEHFKELCLNFLNNHIINYDYTNYRLNNIACLYCNKCFYVCPKRIPIMTYFKLYNDTITNNCNISYQHLTYLKKNSNIILCEECEQELCKQFCPNSLDIKKSLQKIHLFGV